MSKNKKTYFNLNNFKLVSWDLLSCGSEIKILGKCSNYHLLVSPLKLSWLATPIQLFIHLWGRQLTVLKEAAQKIILKTGSWKCLKHHYFLYFILVDPPLSLPIQSVLSPNGSTNSCTLDLKQLTTAQKIHFKQGI